jgi:hypothetical protein
MKRQVRPELLDTLSPEDPRAMRSRRDLRRINWWMRNHNIMAQTLREKLPSAPRCITEIGAGDGKFLLCLAKKLSRHWRDVNVRLLDQQNIFSQETLASFADLNWRTDTIIADALRWTPSTETDTTVVANLFLHHFEDSQLSGLLHKVSQDTKLFVAIEPHRFSAPRLVGQLLWLIGCNDVTRHDAVVSIRAGFAGQEISALWPDKANWELTERHAGLFSHLFIARRRQ